MGQTGTEICESLRKVYPGSSIVFTHGTFDVLHYGHFRFLESCKRLGNLVVVGLYDDEAVRAIKGKSRPVHLYDQRETMLAALKDVDFVIPMGDDGPLPIITALKPDFIAIASDTATHQQVTGYSECQTWGGETRVFPKQGGISTSRILDWQRSLF